MVRMQPIEQYDALDLLGPADRNRGPGKYRKGEAKVVRKIGFTVRKPSAATNKATRRVATGNCLPLDDFEMMAANVADKDPACMDISFDEIRWEDVDILAVSESGKIATDGIPEDVDVHDNIAVTADASPKTSLATRSIVTHCSKVSLNSVDDNTDERETWSQDWEMDVSSSDKRSGHDVGVPLNEDDGAEEFLPENWEAQVHSLAKENVPFVMCVAPHRVPCGSSLFGAPPAPRRENRKLDLQSLRDTFASLGCNPATSVPPQQTTPTHEVVSDDTTNEGVFIRNEDVLLGRGKMSFSHAGNHVFRNHIQRHYQEYQGTKSRVAKMQIIKQIIGMVEEGGGRFLKCFGDNEDDVMAWQPVSSEVAYEKVGHNLRSKKGRPKMVAKAA